MKKSELKKVIKECLHEALIEGIPPQPNTIYQFTARYLGKEQEITVVCYDIEEAWDEALHEAAIKIITAEIDEEGQALDCPIGTEFSLVFNGRKEDLQESNSIADEFRLYETLFEEIDAIFSPKEALKAFEQSIERHKNFQKARSNNDTTLDDLFGDEDPANLFGGKQKEPEDFDKQLNLAREIFTNPAFKFTTKNEIDELSKMKRHAVSFRSVISAIEASNGDKQKFLTWVDTESGFLDNAKKMFHTILG